MKIHIQRDSNIRLFLMADECLWFPAQQNWGCPTKQNIYEI